MKVQVIKISSFDDLRKAVEKAIESDIRECPELAESVERATDMYKDAFSKLRNETPGLDRKRQTDLKTEQRKSFFDAAQPLIKWLAENVHPHHTVIVTATGAELLEGQLSTGQITNYLRD